MEPTAQKSNGALIGSIIVIIIIILGGIFLFKQNSGDEAMMEKDGAMMEESDATTEGGDSMMEEGGEVQGVEDELNSMDVESLDSGL